jgi:phosphatidylserine/phosphatidylglycerophosphate/cardiolipin synthase-like enzyme
MSHVEGLTTLTRADLEVLLLEVEQGRLPCPLTQAALMATGLGHLADQLEVLDGLGRKGVVAALRVALAEREGAPKTALELVWTGPEARVSGARDTAVVVRQLFEHAERTVIVGGYAFDHGAEILRPLHEAMAVRGVEASMFVNLEGRARTAIEVDRAVAAAVEDFLTENWPFGEPVPELYYDPRSVTKGAGASMHAKFVVVDDRLTLITSANFTGRGQTRNVEAGVLIDDGAFAVRLLEQWRGLVRAGLVRQNTR